MNIKNLTEFPQNEQILLVSKLLSWYDSNKRSMPWRDQNNPYYTWISEIMLQQTRVEAVRNYFTRFVEVLPTLEDLAFIDDDSLMKLWEGLGYYSRARNLKKCAIQCMEMYDGTLPSNYDKLVKLPGIGPYTAGAIASIAFGKNIPAIDGNVLRIVARLTNNPIDITSSVFKKSATAQIQAIIPISNPGDFNQALMDLGAMICIPNGVPRCMDCPLKLECKANQAGTASKLPNKQAKRKRTIEERTIIIVEYDNHYLLIKRPSSGLLADLYEFINIPAKLAMKDIRNIQLFDGCTIKSIHKLVSSKHIFTHLEWHMQGYSVKLDSPVVIQNEGIVWATKDQIESQYSIPTALKAFKNAVLQ